MSTRDPIVVDTGPLVALSHRDDPYFERCRKAFQRLPARTPLVTTLAAVAEAMHLLRDYTLSRAHLFRLLISGVFAIESLPASSLPRLQELMVRYADLPIDFADATVIELAERVGATTIFTLDERDFRIYRPRHVPHFRLLPADL